ncbi:hypothetical protein N9751_01060 [Alphaproteobacteria bacterium]|nr:hypothetical protein [Alphaproteobacteria bacterium]MDB9825040.1 hypothetical protein [Alphaproteobacteria bacterium]
MIPLYGGLFLYINLILLTIFNKLLNINDLQIFTFLDYQTFIFISLCFFISLVDDKTNISPYKRFFLFSLIFSLNIFFDNSLHITNLQLMNLIINFNNSFIMFLFMIFCFLSLSNALNFFDGINLQLALYTIVVFMTLYFFGVLNILAVIIIINLLFFIYYNYKSKIFLGDSGVILISYLMTIIFFKLHEQNDLDVSLILIILLVPGLDFIRVITSRILNKANPFTGDSTHLHHLIKKRFSILPTVFLIQLNIISPLIIFFYINNIYISLSLGIILYILLLNIPKFKKI